MNFQGTGFAVVVYWIISLYHQLICLDCWEKLWNWDVSYSTYIHSGNLLQGYGFRGLLFWEIY